MSTGWLLGLDMGGTNIRCAAVSMSGRVVLMRRTPAMADGAADEVAMNIANSVRALEAAARGRRLRAPAAIGIATPGPIDLTRGVVIATPHIPAWRSYPLRARLRRELGRPITLENDANAWALGEFWRGAARGLRNVVLLTLGTGVGGGLIVNGEIVHGASGMAAELGHITVEARGLPCDCGARGCLEAYASATGIRQLAEREYGERGKMPSRLLNDRGRPSVRRLRIAARNGDRFARRVMDQAGGALGIAIASLLNTFDPEMVVIGGGVARALPVMRASMMREVRARAFVGRYGKAKIVRAALGENAGVVGAAYAAMKSL